ncbi:hypothetical protein, partial [Deinococcus alpinitundrae]|uniref:hypothetical protein n=1 Tax=Deinococcus alpinitundrae TaxID=468913 RepID=UPI001ED9117B
FFALGGFLCGSVIYLAVGILLRILTIGKTFPPRWKNFSTYFEFSNDYTPISTALYTGSAYREKLVEEKFLKILRRAKVREQDEV